MAFVFQYGSNLSTERLNDPERLNGDARVVGNAVTQDDYEFEFDIWSTADGGRAASDIVVGRGRKIWGVIYEIPDYLIYRKTAKLRGRTSLDAIEGEGGNYQRVSIELKWLNGRQVREPVITYVGKTRLTGKQTTWDYVRHILTGMDEHGARRSYRSYVMGRIIANDPSLREAVVNHDACRKLSPKVT